MTTRLRRRAGEVSIDDSSNVHLKPPPGKSTVLGDRTYLAYASDEYAEEGSFQPVAIDLNLDADAGTSDQGDTSFLGPIMGNLLGAVLTKTHNFLGGLIGALSVTGAKSTMLQQGAVVGIAMDGVTEADGVIVAVIDGGDPSSETRVNAMFAARMNNNDAGSGADYGMDLYDAGRDETLYTGGGLALPYANGEMRFSNNTWLVALATAITANVTLTDAPAGSLGITKHATGVGKLFVSDGTKWQFIAVS
jgi:hypothetical protein